MRIISSGSALDERDSSALSLPLFSNRIPGEKLRSLRVIQTCTIPIVAPSRDYVYKQNHCLWMTCSTVPSSTPLCLAHFGGSEEEAELVLPRRRNTSLGGRSQGNKGCKY